MERRLSVRIGWSDRAVRKLKDREKVVSEDGSRVGEEAEE